VDGEPDSDALCKKGERAVINPFAEYSLRAGHAGTRQALTYILSKDS
jgi:hypothetical protein